MGRPGGEVRLRVAEQRTWNVTVVTYCDSDAGRVTRTFLPPRLVLLEKTSFLFKPSPLQFRASGQSCIIQTTRA